jgi:hypothetical protein
MYKMKDTSMTGCADTAFQLVAACSALAALAAVNSEHTGQFGQGGRDGLQGLPERMRKIPQGR